MNGSRWSEPGDAGEARPVTNANFLVDLGAGNPERPAAGFYEVVFPPFPSGGACSAPLILRRGVTGSRDLIEWWDQARAGKPAEPRTVTVALLADDRTTVVRTWHFARVRPVALSYSPLNALQGTVLMESIELIFETIDIR